MKQKTIRIIIGSVSIGILLCMCIGSCFDYQISQFLYHPNQFIGVLLASYGQAPAMLCFAIGGTLLVSITDSSNRIKWGLMLLIGILLNGLAIMGITMDPMLYIEDMSLIVSFMIALFLTILVDVIFIKMSRGCDKRSIKLFILLILSVVFLEMIFIMIIKIPWGRPRMRMISVQPEAAFQPWWVIGSEMKQQLMPLGVAAEEFKSFPSGHTGNAAVAMLLVALPMVSSKLKGKETMLWLIGFCFALLVAGSRIVMGAHFLTDVTVGFAITWIIELCALFLIRKKNS